MNIHLLVCLERFQKFWQRIFYNHILPKHLKHVVIDWAVELPAHYWYKWFQKSGVPERLIRFLKSGKKIDVVQSGVSGQPSMAAKKQIKIGNR